MDIWHAASASSYAAVAAAGAAQIVTDAIGQSVLQDTTVTLLLLILFLEFRQDKASSHFADLLAGIGPHFINMHG